MRMKPHWIMLTSMCAFFLGSLLFATAPLEETYWFRIFLSILIMPFVSRPLFYFTRLGSYPARLDLR